MCSPGVNVGTEEMVLGVKTSFWGCVGTGNSKVSVWGLALGSSNAYPPAAVCEVWSTTRLFCLGFSPFYTTGDVNCSIIFLLIVMFSSFMAWLHWFLFKLIYLYLHHLSTVIFTGSSGRKSQLPCFLRTLSLHIFPPFWNEQCLYYSSAGFFPESCFGWWWYLRNRRPERRKDSLFLNTCRSQYEVSALLEMGTSAQ